MAILNLKTTTGTPCKRSHHYRSLRGQKIQNIISKVNFLLPLPPMISLLVFSIYLFNSFYLFNYMFLLPRRYSKVVRAGAWKFEGPGFESSSSDMLKLIKIIIIFVSINRIDGYSIDNKYSVHSHVGIGWVLK